jgi:hypothetical protein
MEHQDTNSSDATTHPLSHHESVAAEADVPIVYYLGPVSSYTHQVPYTLVQFDRPAWSISLTDYDLAQAALRYFDSDEYDYKPVTTITG